MDENSRVRDIKQKFELRNIGQLNLPLINATFQSNSAKYARNVAQNLVKPSNSSADLASQSSSHRANVKRTPAFRCEKMLARHDKDCVNTMNVKNSIVTDRVNLFNQLREFEKPGIVPTKEKNDTERVSRDQVATNSAQSTCKPAPVYAQVEKPSKTKSTVSSRKLTNESFIKHKYTMESVKENENSVNKENEKKSLGTKIASDKVNDELSDTLKRVLRSPLPPGPPPKKPPRTFTVQTANTLVQPSSFRSGTRFDGCFSAPPPSLPRPVRSKTESEIMLRKIENALSRHQSMASPKLATRKKFSPEHKTERYADIHKNRRRSADTNCSSSALMKSKSAVSSFPNEGTTTTTMLCQPRRSSSGCFPWAHVDPSTDSDSHIYEDPKVVIDTNQSSLDSGIMTDSLYYMSTPISSINSSPVIRHADNTFENRRFGIGAINGIRFGGQLKGPDDICVENKIKIMMDNAYSKPWVTLSDGSGDSDSIMSASGDDVSEESKVNISKEEYEQVTLKRKGYVQRVASRLISRKQSVMSPFPTDYKHLFECLLLIGLNLDATNNKVPYIKMKYPDKVQIPQWIEHMCFPDAHDWENNSSSNEKLSDICGVDDRYYVVTLTTQEGQRKYVYCRRVKPEGESFSLPLCYCMLSPHRANELYFMILEELENRHGQSDIQFKNFICELYEHKFPLNGQSIDINMLSEDSEGKASENVIKRPQDARVEDLRLAKTLSHLKINIFLNIFASMLLERKVILLSSSISTLSTTIGGLQVALLPFQWQHTLITVVPSNLISVADLCDAPTPYLIGLLKRTGANASTLPNFSNKQQVIVVDLDEKKILRKVGDENTILPSHLTKSIKNALQLAHSSELSANNLLACEAFTRLFVELIGHYRRFIYPHGGGESYKKRSFAKEAFVRAGKQHSVRMFLEWFVETAAFTTFIELRLVNISVAKGLFEERCNEYFEELNRLKYAKNKKFVKQLGGFLKDLTTTSHE